ncbi:unnamed protein product [Rotaria sordida]|uniref:Uncharacterized protein n=1 Tax=Rotaria sordida TaxID=392033 RepID=A0A820J0B8_9BILA|nr:unnamed protein product [Rotaria sordida]
MKPDYSVYPSMIRAQSGLIWLYDNSSIVSTFNASFPFDVSATKCNHLSICLWYIIPLLSLDDSLGMQYVLLGEYNKWTAVRQQQFIFIVTDTEKNQAQGMPSGIVSIVVFHSALKLAATELKKAVL